jgi:hypothetical protein
MGLRITYGNLQGEVFNIGSTLINLDKKEKILTS